MDLSTLFVLCALGALIGIVIAFIRPSFFAYDGGKVPGRLPMAGIWGVMLVASLLGAGYQSSKEEQERNAYIAPEETPASMQDPVAPDPPAPPAPPAIEGTEEGAPAQSPESTAPPPPAVPPDDPPSN